MKGYFVFIDPLAQKMLAARRLTRLMYYKGVYFCKAIDEGGPYLSLKIASPVWKGVKDLELRIPYNFVLAIVSVTDATALEESTLGFLIERKDARTKKRELPF